MENKHTITNCERIPAQTYYIGRGWKGLFKCPECGRETWQHLNFLGRRVVRCDGERISKAAQ